MHVHLYPGNLRRRGEEKKKGREGKRRKGEERELKERWGERGEEDSHHERF
jgi:hypothetical protein